MKQIEITVRLVEKIEEAIQKLKNGGFKKIRESDIDDIYLSNLKIEMKKENIQDFLKHSVLLRNLKLNGEELKKITYKNKEFDSNGNVITEQKVNIDCNDLLKAKKLFEYLGFYQLIEVKYHVIVYEKNGKEFAFQIVDNLGTLIEYENINDFEGKTVLEIDSEKNKMLQDIKECNICITDEYDVKKAFELIKKKYNL